MGYLNIDIFVYIRIIHNSSQFPCIKFLFKFFQRESCFQDISQIHAGYRFLKTLFTQTVRSCVNSIVHRSQEGRIKVSRFQIDRNQALYVTFRVQLRYLVRRNKSCHICTCPYNQANISIIALWYISTSSRYRHVEVAIVKIRECGTTFVEKIIIIIDTLHCAYWIFPYPRA